MTTVAVPTGWSGFPSAAAAATPRPKRTGHGKLIGLLAGGLVAAVAVISAVSALVTPAHHTVVCPPSCGRPPTGTPIQSLPRFTAHDGSFAVDYIPSGSSFAVTADAASVTETTSDGSGAIHLLGMPAQNASAAQTVTGLISAHFPGARRAYVLPNAIVGYQPAYGEVDDYYPQSTNGAYVHERVIVVAAEKNGEVLVAAGIGPYDEYSPNGDGTGHPSGADLKVAEVMDALINSFTWRGDTPR